ncbi:hypothetical protein HanHA300_Chr15g0555721 [Helianthus annuus]|nr:hypothetical protein HanHA300_Chr15g0555721 [Helianthus annuus]KAJ0472212.1 hypothetical protein HanHA89_Chr15g0604481 [Helianthus annuus]KAJ0647809.1 hypothetical protein HanLR1_Chr15g0565801 [Helianthus annuus]KAJ0651674.1 hypothetical protein HanOQP8_Chr15g0563521 [Helianthus annuus]
MIDFVHLIKHARCSMPCQERRFQFYACQQDYMTWEFSRRVKGIKLDIVDTTSAQESRCFSSWSIIKTVMH